MAIKNMASISAKFNAYLNTPAGASAVANSADVMADLATLSSSFIQTMLGCASGASGVASDFSLTSQNIYNGGNSLSAVLTFDFGNKHRDSLAPDRYDGVDNIVALFNNGYSARARVRGMWHGKMVSSLQSRPGLHFVPQAANSFLGAQFGCATVTGVDVDGIYK